VSRVIAPGEPFTCWRCGQVTPAAASGRWKCSPCGKAKNRGEYLAPHPSSNALRMFSRKISADGTRECPRCGWVGPPFPYGAWKCRPCDAEQKRQSRDRQRAAGTYRSPRQPNDVEAAKKRRTYAKNPEPFLARFRQRYEWFKTGDVTSDQLRQIWERDHGECQYCGQRVERPRFHRFAPRGFDHIISMSKGGQHTASNLVVCCRSCNAKKGNR